MQIVQYANSKLTTNGGGGTRGRGDQSGRESLIMAPSMRKRSSLIDRLDTLESYCKTNTHSLSYQWQRSELSLCEVFLSESGWSTPLFKDDQILITFEGLQHLI